METIEERLDRDFLLGIVKYKNIYTPYLMPVVYWILNHEKYNPQYKPSTPGFIFRGNVSNVDDNQVDNFIDAIQEDNITLNELRQILTGDKDGYNQINFFVDFDQKVLVSAFPDIGVEDYLPNDSWKGIFDSPMKYLPENMRYSIT